MPQAHADMFVPRDQLGDPDVRKAARVLLYRTLMKLGRVERIQFTVDPPDEGPHGPPTDEMAVIRATANVIPPN